MVRLQRIGKKGQAYFRFVVLEHTVRPKGKYLELLGSYDPHQNTMDVKVDRVKHWMSKGAKLSPTANNLLVGKKLIEGEKVQVWKAKKKEATEAPSTPVAPQPKPVPEVKSQEAEALKEPEVVVSPVEESVPTV